MKLFWLRRESSRESHSWLVGFHDGYGLGSQRRGCAIHPVIIPKGTSDDGAGGRAVQQFRGWKDRNRVRQGNQKVGFRWVVIDECVDRVFKPGEMDKVGLRVRGAEHVNGSGPACRVGLQAG